MLKALVAIFTCFVISNQSWSNTQKYKTVSKQLIFEQNKGQFDSKIKYLSKGKGYNIALGLSPVIELFRYDTEQSNKANTFDLDVQQKHLKLTEHSIFELQITNANPKAKVIPENQVVTKTNYLIGEKNNWKTNIANFGRIRYEEILKNIDVVYYGKNGRLEYDFIVKPKAKVSDIELTFNGIKKFNLNNKGQLILDLGKHKIIQNSPIAYQINSKGIKNEVVVKYQLSDNRISFMVDKYDPGINLVIDPVLEYSRYYGGSKNELVVALDVDSSDNIYMIGHSASPNLASNGAYQENNLSPLRDETVTYSTFDCTDPYLGGSQCERFHILPPSTSSVFVTKFSPDGTTVLWATYFSHPDSKALTLGVNSAAVSANGEVAFGLTSSVPVGLPLVNSTQVFSETQENAYVAKLNMTGDSIVFSTYLSVGTNELFGAGGWLRGLDVSDLGNVAVTGFVTGSSNGVADIDFPEINPISGHSCAIDGSSFEDLTDGWVILFDNLGAAIFSSCLGGSQGSVSIEALRGVAIGSSNNLYVLGYTSMTDFPVVNSIQSTLSFPDYKDTTITEIDPINSVIVFSTYLGPLQRGVAADASGRPTKQNFPIDIKVDTQGNIYVSGSTNLTSWPNTNAFQPNLNLLNTINSINSSNGDFRNLNTDSYLTKINPATSNIVFSTYIGGEINESFWNTLTLDANGNSYMLLMTDSDDYPVTNSIQAIKFGRTSAVISKFSPNGALIFSSFHGGTDNIFDSTFYPGGIVVNSQGKLVVSTNTHADDFNVVGSTTSRSGGFDATLSIIDQSVDLDTDGDGVVDNIDDFPNDASEWRDSDSDFTGDNADTNDDNDAVLDINDNFPLNSNEFEDSDGDGIGNMADAFPSDELNILDSNMNGEGDYTEEDFDNDGFSIDFRPFDALEWADVDGDGLGDNADLDDDNDGVLDVNDVAPLDSNNPTITLNGFNSQSGINKSPLPSGFTHLVGTDAEWTSATDQSLNGKTSLSTISPDDNQVAGLQYDEVFEAGVISFQYKVDSEQGFDFLVFSIDGQILLIDSGQVEWTDFSTSIAAGAHVLVWKYIKNGSISIGTDAVWIDDLEGFPSANIDLDVSLLYSSILLLPELSSYVQQAIAIENKSSLYATRVRFQSTVSSEVEDISWNCESIGTSSCNSQYLMATNSMPFGQNNINVFIDLPPLEKIIFSYSGIIDIERVNGSINFTGLATIDTGIREDDTSNNVINSSIFLGFSDGFE